MNGGQTVSLKLTFTTIGEFKEKQKYQFGSTRTRVQKQQVKYSLAQRLGSRHRSRKTLWRLPEELPPDVRVLGCGLLQIAVLSFFFRNSFETLSIFYTVRESLFPEAKGMSQAQRSEYQNTAVQGVGMLLNEYEVAQLLSVSIGSVRRWRQVQQGPKYIKIGASVRYKPQEVFRFLDSLPTGGGSRLERQQ